MRRCRVKADDFLKENAEECFVLREKGKRRLGKLR
jgi:hypothetical protein